MPWLILTIKLEKCMTHHAWYWLEKGFLLGKLGFHQEED